MAIKSVLITGCSAGGIGSALAEAFQKRGLHVFVTAGSLSKISHLEKLPNVTLLTLDVTSSSSIAAAVEAVSAKTDGTLDYLVNNSGSRYVMPTLDIDIEECKRMFDANLWGVPVVTQAFARLVIAVKGTIVNNSSIAACIYSPWMSLYSASKSALTTVSETLRLEMAPFGVKVVTAVTGAVDTNFFVNSPEYKLPSTSRYMPMQKTIATKATGEDMQKRMKAAEYARKVVGDVLGGTNGKIWRGPMATFVRFGMTFFPTFYIDKPLRKMNGLDTFAKTIQAGKV